MNLSKITKIEAFTGLRKTYHLSTGETLLKIPTLGNAPRTDRISLDPHPPGLTFEFDVDREWQPLAALLACILRFANISLNHNLH